MLVRRCVFAVSESLTRTGGSSEAKTRGGFVAPSDDIEEVTQLLFACVQLHACRGVGACVHTYDLHLLTSP